MKLKQSILAAAMLVAVPMQAQALTTTAAMTLTANVISPSATVVTTPISFGTILKNDSTATASGTITVNVTNGVPYSVAIGGGQNQNTTGTGACRRMVDPATSAWKAYNLYTDAAYTVLWGDAVAPGGTGPSCMGAPSNGGLELAGKTGTGVDQAYNVYVKLQATGAPAGNVTDTVTVTVKY